MRFIEQLYEETKDIWEDYYNHPFIKGIETGELDLEKFKFYMVQDYIYLWDYSKLFALGILKSENKKEIRLFSNSLDSTLNYEMDIHRAYMKRLGISEKEVLDSKTSLINLSYTNYMLSVSQKGGKEEVVAALLSCAWTYADIALRIDKNNPAAKNHELYGEWLSGYLDQEFQQIAGWFKEKINEIGEGISESKKDELSQIFRNCCMFELRFWDMSYAKALDFKAIEIE